MADPGGRWVSDLGLKNPVSINVLIIMTFQYLDPFDDLLLNISLSELASSI